MTTGEGRHGTVLAVRLPRVIADKLDEAANHFGGYGKVIEAMATEQALPPDWFYKKPGDVRGPHDVRVTFRLSARAKRALRAWGGRRPLSKVIRHLVVYTVTAARRHPALEAEAADVPASPAPRVASQPVPARASPPALPSTAFRPPMPRPAPSHALPPARLTPAEAFSHLPPPRPELPYVCELQGCEFGRGSGAVVRCRQHVTWVAPAFRHLPVLPVGQRYICQVSTCRYTQGDGVSTGAMVVPAWCREHA